MDQQRTKPALRAYSVVNRDHGKSVWLPIGAAFIHQDGIGFNVVLQALPIDGRIVLRPIDQRTDERT